MNLVWFSLFIYSISELYAHIFYTLSNSIFLYIFLSYYLLFKFSVIGLDKSIKQKSECPFCRKKALGSIKAGPNVKIQEMIQKLSMQPKIQAPPPQINSFQSSSSFPIATTTGDYKQLPFKEIEKYLIPGTKYFIIKSSNFENLELSIKHSEWATTKNNEVAITITTLFMHNEIIDKVE